MVLGFIVFWPIGLAILGYKFWQRKIGGARPADGRRQYLEQRARAAMAGGSTPRPWSSGPWVRGFTAPPTGNRAFDEWKNAELVRLEEERRKLEDAHREFADSSRTSARRRTARSSSAS